MSDTTAGRATHAHRLGPFHTGPDPSVHDEAIVALTGAIAARCETCTGLQTLTVAASTPVLVRLVELVDRGHIRPAGSLNELAGNDGRIGLIADLAEVTPVRRAAYLDDLGAEGRAQIADTAARLLVGVWIPATMRAEAPARAAAEAQRVTERYGLTGPPAGGEPEWAWAHLHAARRTWEGASAGSYTTVYTLHLAATADISDENYVLGPIELERPSERREADLILKVQAWAPAWPPERWTELAPETIGQGNFTWPNGQIWNHSDDRWIMRVRRGAPAATEPVPYHEDFRWPLESNRHYPHDDSTVYGPPPGRIRYALQSIVKSENGEYDQFLSRPLANSEAMREHLTEQAAQAREKVEAFRQWLHDQIQAHGWPRAGADFANFSLAVLAWVASDPDEHRRAGSAEYLAAAVTVGHADPAHLDALDRSNPLSTAELLDAVRHHYPDA